VTDTRKNDAGSGKVGVGLLYQKEFQPFIVEHIDLLDYMEVVPDTAWTDHGEGATPRYVDDREALHFFQQVRERIPIVSHSIGLSIASAHRFRQEHVDQIRRWDRMFDFPWHSDHLWFSLVNDPVDGEYLAGVAFPVVFDRPMLEMLVDRVHRVRDQIDKPFLLENNVSYIEYPDQDFDEPTFFNEMCTRSGCGILLDLHNIYVNWQNNATDMEAFVADLDLSHVVEIHLGGGLHHEGFYLDAHSGRVPEDLWGLVGDTVRASPNLRGITFELLGSWYPKMGPDALQETLLRMRELAQAVGVA
jgi:uncharacterized protein (UPF0276 family)